MEVQGHEYPWEHKVHELRAGGKARVAQERGQ